MKQLLGNDNVLMDTPGWNKTSLVRRDYLGNIQLQSIHHYFGDELVANIAQRNGSELINKLRLVNFWNETNISSIDATNVLKSGPHLLDKFTDILMNNTQFA